MSVNFPTNENAKLNDHGKQQKKAEKEEAYYVASQWQLMWWKFRKHKLAMIAAPVLIILYLGAIFADFLVPAVPEQRFPDYKNAPPQVIRFYEEGEGWQKPFVYEIKRHTDPETFQRVYTIDKSKKYPVHFFGRGVEYKLFGLFNTNIHLITSDGPLFLLGTDALGRDLYTRILYGSRISLSIGLVGVAITFVLGLLLGGISGYIGGVTDTIIQRIIDLIICIPTIPLWMALAAALPRNWSPVKMYLAIVMITSIIGWTGLARVVRGKVLSLREEDFTTAARLAGAGDMYIITRHMIPSFASYIIVSLTLSIPSTILGETSLSFLGLGLQPPAVSWGVLLQDAQKLDTIAHQPWLLLPIIWIVVTVLMFNFLGDGLRDAADPYK
ncbi:ABC transporter permease [Mahella australiensis]|uniref:Binding-protein-dependent transport systems inner membrane component n=1 Tax=Mahella australiensis (strain DSM 15567 / CIP 107919 / 50-1 BON) TaxID=697281 RepID=F3ZW16_MAHA5|nr:ABC transporter permease [Mahella australiensis]AEE96396.1 binding-protein-dependent transport systems inner membrane component [Mahella australiensis 50-1 BON]